MVSGTADPHNPSRKRRFRSMSLASIGRAEFRAMGTTVEVHASAPDLARASARVERLFRAWDDALTRFRDTSELSALNRAAGRPFAASELLFRVIAAALQWARETQGTFDPTLSHQIERLGYRRTFEDIEREGPQAPLKASIEPGGAWRSMILDPARRTIFLPAGVGVDLGGIAKGMAVDAALVSLREAGFEAALVNAGGDLAVYGRPPCSDGWPIAVAEVPDEVVALTHGAMATSGIARRHWIQGDTQRHHLLDAASGYPANTSLRSVTVAAQTCEAADVAATTAFLRGAHGGAAFLRQQGMAGLIVPEDGPPIRVEPWPAKAR